jgi:hypothetical protein
VNVSRSARLCSAAVFLFAASLFAQQPATIAAEPIPAPIFSAQKVFIANAGMDASLAESFQSLSLSQTEPYDSFYSAMQAWGRYQLVSSPADADLVFEIHVAAPGCGAAAQLQNVVTIDDAHTHFVLWTVTQPVKAAARKVTWRKNIAASNVALIAQLKSLTSPPSHASAAP